MKKLKLTLILVFFVINIFAEERQQTLTSFDGATLVGICGRYIGSSNTPNGYYGNSSFYSYTEGYGNSSALGRGTSFENMISRVKWTNKPNPMNALEYATCYHGCTIVRNYGICRWRSNNI